MQQISFRSYHLLRLLYEHDAQPSRPPLDAFMNLYFRNHKALGSKDKAEIGELLYALYRWKGLLDARLGAETTWEARLQLLTDKSFKASPHENLAAYERLSFPRQAYELLASFYGDAATASICAISNERAPLTVRANALRCTREQLLERWQGHYRVSPTIASPWGLQFAQRVNLFQMPEFRDGWFEIQDEASQLIAACIQAAPGQRVLDWCAGSGGKSLAIAPFLQGQGQLFLHDIRPQILAQAKKRLKRAGIQNAQILSPTDGKRQQCLKHKMDWVLVDAPCSGSGTWRRSPDMKWKFHVETLRELQGMQRIIFEKALSFLKPDGLIAYATCSIFEEENERQVAHFQKVYGLEPVNQFKSLPISGGMDGMFAAVLRRK